MKLGIRFYVVTKDVAQRTGDIGNTYRTDDGRYVMDSRLLGRIRLTEDEFLTGLKGIEMVSREEALTLIARGGYDTENAHIVNVSDEEGITTEENEVPAVEPAPEEEVDETPKEEEE